MGRTVCPDEHRCRGAIKEVSAGPGTEGTLPTSPEASPSDAFLVSQVEAEEQADIAESFNIEAVPTFLILRVEYTDRFH